MFEALVKNEGAISHLGGAGEPVERLIRQFAADPVPLPSMSQKRGSEPVQPCLVALDSVRRMPLQLAAGVPVFPFDASNAQIVEQYRIARTKLFHDVRKPRVIVVSSAAPKDGKTITSINLAGILALKPELKIALVEADLHHTHIGSLLGLPATPGLTDVLTGKASLAEALVRVEQCPNLFVLPGGSKHSGPTELLDSPAWRSLCEALRREFSYVVVDSPPMGLLADFELLQAVSDGVVMVIRPDHSNRADCLQALESIRDQNLLGVILNGTEDWPFYKSGNSKYYAYDTAS